MNLGAGRQEKWVEQRGSLTIDGKAIGQFVDAMFRHADKGSFVSLRGFPDTQEGPPFTIIGVQIGDDLSARHRQVDGLPGRTGSRSRSG
jgi:hypothetical protein